MQHPALTPQQEAIREVRSRYERGEITFDRFEYALSALLSAQSPEECRAIVQELQPSPVAAFDAMVAPAAAPATPASPAVSAPRLPDRRWLVGIVGEFKRLKRPWRMGQRTTAVMGIGELELDMSLASMPQHSILDVYALIGEVTLYVPSSMHVSVRTFNVIGETNAFGESRGGIFNMMDEEEFSPQGAGAPHLEIRVFMLIGEVNVKQVDAPVVTLIPVDEKAQPPALPQPQ